MYQAGFANDQASRRGWPIGCGYTCAICWNRFPDGTFGGVWTNGTTMYVDLSDLYREVARLLRPGCRSVCITGCANDILGDKSAAVAAIDEHHRCRIHPRSAFFRALAGAGLVPVKVRDLTPDTLPCWELRDASPVRTGIEDAFLSSYRDGTFRYLLIVADRRRL